MKRLALALMLIATGLSVCWAAVPLETKNLEVSLDLGSESGAIWYDFGFSSTPVGSGKETPQPVRYDPTAIAGNSISLSLKEGETGRIAENDEDSLWAYWHITSGTGLTIDIQGDGVMDMAGAGEGNDDIDWNIALDSAQTGTDQATKQNVYTHEPTENGVGADGSRKITLTTEDLTGLTLAPGKYTANLVLSITKN